MLLASIGQIRLPELDRTRSDGAHAVRVIEHGGMFGGRAAGAYRRFLSRSVGAAENPHPPPIPHELLCGETYRLGSRHGTAVPVGAGSGGCGDLHLIGLGE